MNALIVNFIWNFLEKNGAKWFFFGKKWNAQIEKMESFVFGQKKRGSIFFRTPSV